MRVKVGFRLTLRSFVDTSEYVGGKGVTVMVMVNSDFLSKPL